MVRHSSNIQKALSIVFALILFMGFIRSNSYENVEKMFKYLGQDENKVATEKAAEKRDVKTTNKTNKTAADPADEKEEEILDVDSIESGYASEFYMKKDLVNLNGYFAKKLDMKGLYSSMGMYVTDDDYIVSAYDKTSTDYEYKETVGLRDFLEENRIKFLYVNEPAKYVDDSIMESEFGVETYSNRNMDLFLERIRKAGINTIDLRDNIKEENLNIEEMFYRTDHHWTVPTGFWASKIIAQALNDYCGYHIDMSVYDESKFTKKEWKESWLGEQGRKVSESYVGRDDFTEIKPDFPTSYVFKNKNGSTYTGTFDDFINEDIYSAESNAYETPSWHYSYSRIDCINNNVKDGKILLLCDSYDHVTEPFLSLGVHEIDSLILRVQSDNFNLRDYVLKNEYDTVIVAYAQIELGQHDDKDSAAFSMYKFE